MATTASPMGLRPLKLLGDRVYNHGIRQFKIASGYATNIFNGDLVKLVAAGTIEKDTGTATATPVGVFLGVEYSDPSLNYLLHSQYWPASTVAADAMAYVVDDPDMLFLVQASATLDRTAIGANAEIVQGAGSTATGNSGVTLNAATVAVTGTLPLRIIGFKDEDEIGSAFPWLVVKINEGDHQYRNSTGV